MPSAPAVTVRPAFRVRTVQLLRALLAAAAALMVTFSADHSAEIGLAVFSGFAIATGVVHLVAAWVVFPSGGRVPSLLLGVVGLATGMVAGVPGWRSALLFFVLVIAWAVLTGTVELIAGLRGRRAGDPAARDAILVGALSLLLAAALLVVPVQYAWDYTIEGAGAFTLTGIILAVGLFGAYAALVAVFLGIAGFSPRSSASSAPADPGTVARDSAVAATENGSSV